MTSQTRLTMPIGEAMFSQRAIRKLRPDPIPVEDIHTLLDAAVKAPNGGNHQPGRFMVVTDRALLQQFGALYHEAWWAKRRDREKWSSKADIPPGSQYQHAAQLADEMKDAPAVVLVCAPRGTAAPSVLPSAQNLMLAARALEIGSVLTMLHPQVDERVRALFRMPADVEIFCCIPLGYPRGKFGPTTRLPTAKTAFFNAWGAPPPWS
ncbi:MAG: nitroreductase family protein [Candidatus Lambdaproteobacteria bacterium]|nr:nitroreductase family protein [Candidatus Lambdaproteobacteria bacterium]